MRTVIIAGTAGLTLGMGLTACSSGPTTMSRPAPPTALDCALKVATDSGFTPVKGGVADHYFVVDRPRGWSKADVAGEATKRALTFGLGGGNRSIGDELTLTGAGGSLRVTAASVDRGRNVVGPSSEALAAQNYILSSCATP